MKKRFFEILVQIFFFHTLLPWHQVDTILRQPKILVLITTVGFARRFYEMQWKYLVVT